MTRNNRLERCEVYAGEDDAGPLLRTVKYLYYKTGDVSNITVKDEYHDPNLTPGDPNDYQWYNDLALYYDKGRNVRMVLRGRWKSDGEGGFEDYERHWSREFMYDNPRARFMARELDPDTFDPLLGSENPWHWTDYAGVTPTLDLELRAVAADPNQLTITEKRSYGPGGWQDLAYDPNDPNAPPTVSATRYVHGDLIDSVVLTTDESAAAVATAAYTAFGELITCHSELDSRYRYAGGWGYEGNVLYGSHHPLSGPNPTLAPVVLLHVGARWYDPSIGRFVQRDPIGLNGGLNAYVYVANLPTVGIDPSGHTGHAPPPRIFENSIWPTDKNGWLKPCGPNEQVGRDKHGRRIPVPRDTPIPPIGPLTRAGAIGVAVGVGVVAGLCIDYASGQLNDGYSISDGFTDLFLRWWWDDGTGYNPWGATYLQRRAP